MKPAFWQFIVAALIGACTGIWFRVLGALAINNAFSWQNLVHLVSDSRVVPMLSGYAFVAFVIVGSPLFLWLRRKDLLELRWFVVVGAVAGFLSSFPYTVHFSWAAIYTFSGVVAAVVCFAVLAALTRSSTGRASRRAG